MHSTKPATQAVKHSCLFLAFLFAASASGWTQAKPSASPGLDAEKLQSIKPRLQELVDKQVIPGAVYLVARHGKIAAFDAVGLADIENNKPMRKDTLFQIMSMTKNFTGVAAMMRVEQGKLDLRRPISYYLPEFKDIAVEEKTTKGGVTTHP